MSNDRRDDADQREEILKAGDSSEDELAYIKMLKKRARTVLHFIKLTTLILSVVFTISIVGIYCGQKTSSHFELKIPDSVPAAASKNVNLFLAGVYMCGTLLLPLGGLALHWRS